MADRSWRKVVVVSLVTVVGVTVAALLLAFGWPEDRGTREGPLDPGPTWSEQQMEETSPEPIPSE